MSAAFENKFSDKDDLQGHQFRGRENLPDRQFQSQTRLIVVLRTPQKFAYFTDPRYNADACDHVITLKKKINAYELRREDIYGLEYRDYNDLIVEVSPDRKNGDHPIIFSRI